MATQLGQTTSLLHPFCQGILRLWSFTLDINSRPAPLQVNIRIRTATDTLGNGPIHRHHFYASSYELSS